MIAKNAAAKNPEVLKEDIMLSTKRIIKTVMINDTRPNVKKLIGKVSSLKIKPIVAFANAINTAAPSALINPVTSTPGTSLAPIKKASPIKRTSIINLIMLNLLMFKSFYKFLIVALFALFLISCSGTNKKPIIKFSQDSASIVIKNLDKASLLKVRDAYAVNADSNQLITVLIKPGEQDSLQDETLVNGKTKLIGDSIVFKPDLPFVKGKDYVVESLIGVEFATVEKLILSQVKQSLQPQRQTLKR